MARRISNIISRRSAIIIALIYLIFGLIWITASDNIVFGMSSDLKFIRALQLQKGYVFVGISALLIFFLYFYTLKRSIEGNQKLLDIDHQFKRMFENMKEGYMYTDLKGNILNVNPYATEITGYSKEEFLKLNLVNDILAHPKDKARLKTLLEKYEEAPLFQFQIRNKKNKLQHIEASIQYVVDEQGIKVAIEGTFRDISLQIEAEKALLESESMYRTMFDSASDGILILKNYIVVDCNKIMVDRYGFESKSKLIGLQPWDFSPEFQPDGIHSKRGAIDLIEAALKGEAQSFYWQHLTPDGKLVDMSIALNRFYTRNEAFIFVTLKDITQQKKNEARILFSEEKFSKSFKMSPSLMILFNAVTKEIIDVNKSYETITGYSTIETLHLAIDSLPVWTDMQEIKRIIGNGIISGEFTKKDINLFTKDGSTKSIELSGDILDLKNEQFVLLVGQDITIRKENEKQLRDLSLRVQDIQEEERKILARELHDQVGQNLTAFNVNLSLLDGMLAKTELDAPKNVLNDTMNIVEETIRSIRDVMAELRPQLLDDYGLEAALDWYIKRIMLRTDIKIRMVKNAELGRLEDNTETAIFRIVQEALTNMVKHSQAENCYLTIDNSNGSLEISVADNGKGFRMEDKKKGNHGLGLINMRERAQAFGGDVEIDSMPDEGTTVRIKLKSK